MLYPPILASTQPVFSINDTSFDILFTLANITSAEEVNSIDLLVSQQSNNKSIIVQTKDSPAGIKTGINFDKENLKVTVTPSKDFDTSRWQAGNLYKVQLRFVDSDGNKSEWSTVMIIKPIIPPTLNIEKEKNILAPSNIEMVSSLTPTFFGKCSMAAENKESEEFYRFKIYEGETLLEDLGWQNHVNGKEDVGYFTTVLQNSGAYSVSYEIKTYNEYTQIEGPLDFVAIQSTIGDLSDITFTAQGNVKNACVDISLQSVELLSGNFVITRASNKDNFKHFEDIKFLNVIRLNITNSKVIFQDYTIESGITYQYGFQKITTNIRTNMLLSLKQTVNFEYSYLYHDDIQLELRFNNTISNFKHSVLRSKQDTLGDKYPHLLQNGNAYYAEFPISGLISYQGNTETFFTTKLNGIYYQDKLIIEKEKFQSTAEQINLDGMSIPLRRYEKNLNPIITQDNFNHKSSYNFEEAIANSEYAYSIDEIATSERRRENIIDDSNSSSSSSSNSINSFIQPDYSISINLTDDNIYIERKFREKVEEFLNNFDYKLFKSPTEGNIVITLMNVTLTPVASLGRMLYEFSATAYEVLDNTLDQLNTYGIINIDEPISLQEIADKIQSFGQIVYWPQTSETNLYATIQSIEHYDIEKLYEYILYDILKIWIEPYPKVLLEEQLNQLDDSNSDQVNQLKQYLNTIGKVPILLNIQSSQNNILISPNQIYTLDYPLSQNLVVKQCMYPIIINYMCDLTLEPKLNIQIIESIATEKRFNQIAQIFKGEADLLLVIKQAIKQELGDTITELSDGTWKDKSGKEYIFSGLDSIDIEADIGTIFELGTSSNEYNTYKIGYNTLDQQAQFESNRIFFSKGLSHIGYFHLPNAAYVIINFAYRLEIRTYSSGE